MTMITEGVHTGEYIVREEGRISREVVTLSAGNNLSACTVLGRISKAAATAAAVAGNTGNGTIGPVATGPGVEVATYRLTCIEPLAGSGKFAVEDPLGRNVGVATVGVEFNGAGLVFTIAAGGVDFEGGDSFNITVAPGSGKYSVLDMAAFDGTEIATAILYDNVDASASDKPAVITARKAEVSGAALVWPAGVTADQKAAAVAQLAALGIIVR